jgi:hypothetical protein
MSTMSISIEYKKPIPTNLEWVLVRTNSHVVSHGRYDLDVFIVDPADNGILAIARHVVYLRPLKMPLGGHGSRERRKDAKI